MKYVGLLLSAFVVACAIASSADAAAPIGPNTISGRVSTCGKGVVYLYAALPEFSAADGSAKDPQFEQPAADAEHWETPCASGAFTFARIPNGTYVAGVPAPMPTSKPLSSAVTVDNADAAIELKPEDPAH